MIRPLRWNNNVGLRMELYGCSPGYYFVATLVIVEPSALFTLEFVDKSSENCKTWAADCLTQIRDVVQFVPGFLGLKFRRFRLDTSYLDKPSVRIEVEIHCIKDAAYSIAENLRISVNTKESMFTPSIDFQYPVNSSCFLPEAHVHLNKTITEATEVLTTSNVTLRGDVTFCNTKIKSLLFVTWEIFIIVNKNQLTKPLFTLNLHDGSEYVFEPRFCEDCYPSYLYVRFTAHINELGGRKVDDFGVLKIVQPALVAVIRGPNEAKKGFDMKVVLNASESYDPDSLSLGAFNFTWLCKRKKEAVFKHCQHGRTAANGMLFFVAINRLKSNDTLEFKLLVSKGYRYSCVVHGLKIMPSIDVSFRCASNCGEKVLRYKSFKIIPECRGLLCSDVDSIHWSTLVHTTTSNGKQWKRITHKKAAGLKPPPSSLFNSLKTISVRDLAFKLKAVVKIIEAKEVIKEEYGMIFVLNSPPSKKSGTKSGCFVEPGKGQAVETTFNISCVAWQDEDKPLTYEFRYNTSVGLVINVPTTGIELMNTLSTKLPVGDRFENYHFPVDIYIRDSLGDLTIERVTIQVLDNCADNVNHTVHEMAYMENKKFNDDIAKGKFTEALDLVISVLSLLEKRKPCDSLWGYDVNGNLRQKVKNNFIQQLVGVTPNSKELLAKVTNYLALATKNGHEISQDSQEDALQHLDRAMHYFSRLFNSSTDGKDVLEVSKNILLAAGNILRSSSGDASFNELNSQPGYKEKSKQIVRKALHTTWKFRDCLVVEGDKPLVITGGFISMVIYRPRRNESTVRTEVDKMEFTLPNYGHLFSELGTDRSAVTAKVVLFKSNPYTWHPSASSVNSWVLDVVLQKNDRTNLNISGLKEPIKLFIPQDFDRSASLSAEETANTDQYFVKPSYDVNETILIKYHQINLTDNNFAVLVKLRPESSTYTPLRVYVSVSDFPTPAKHNFSTVIPNCEKLRRKTKTLLDCIKNPKKYLFSFTASETGHAGIHYIGIHYYVKRSNYVKDRTRRSCGVGGTRQKRSCVEVKPPPPLPTPTPLVLRSSYNASTDLRYNFSVTIGSCLYWSEGEQQWSQIGCNVSSEVIKGSIHCLCNHLSAFGGDVFEPPNKIDFKKVFSNFANIGENKNVVVLTTVCTMLLFYVVCLIIARRADKRDEKKTIPNICLPDYEEHGVHHYHISIATGMWMGSGTTANVGIIMYGEERCSGEIILNDFRAKETFFARASVNTFTLSLPRSLGALYKLKVWHDNTGDSPGWFLLDIVVTESKAKQKWHFIGNRWLAVERDSGEIELTINASNKEDMLKFKNLFYHRASKRLADGHLWISIFARPPQSSFTRTQRLSCCMSLFFCAMIANAMFYKLGEGAKDTVQIGPLSMSWTQVKIGIQSAMIVLPVNGIIVAIFRNVKPKKQPLRDSQLLEENSLKGLPHFCIYVAWILCILAILSSSSFTLQYSMYWGAKISNEWLTSIIVSFVEDVVVLQPIKVVMVACLLSVLIRKPANHDPVQGLPRHKQPCENDSAVQPPKEKDLEKSRTFWVKHRKMFRSVVEITLFVVFALLLFIVCYGNRDSSRYRLTKSLKDTFKAFDNHVNSTPDFWNWTRERLVPGVYFSEWNNGRKVELQEGFINSGYPFLLGMPRLRQIRVKADSCHITDLLHVKRCLPYYSSMSEDKSLYNLRDWTPISNISAFETLFGFNDLCPRPWRYQTSEIVGTLPFYGFYGIYGGGGYIADLGYNPDTALEVINDLENSDWIDDRTFAVFVEFTVYEPSSTLFSAAKYLYERNPTGGSKTTSTIDTLMIYYPVDRSFTSYYLVCQLILIIFIFGLFIVEIIKLYFQGCRYFTRFWNIVDIVQIIAAVAAITQYFFKAKFTSEFARRVRENPFMTSSSDYIVRWCHFEIWFLSFVVFLVTIKMLRLIKFNHHICHLTFTVKSAAQHLASYSVVFTATLLAYSQLGTLLFGNIAGPYSNMARSLTTLLERLLGNNMYTKELKEGNGVTGQLFTFAYSFSIAMILINMFLSILHASYIEVRLLKQGCYPDAELAQFAWRYFSKKIATYWGGVKRSLQGGRQLKSHLRRRKSKYCKAPTTHALHHFDKHLCAENLRENPSASSCLLEKEPVKYYRSLSPGEIHCIDDLDDIDIDMVDEFTSLIDIKKTLLQMGTSLFSYRDHWSSTSLHGDSDREGTSSPISDWSQSSNKSLFDVEMAESWGYNIKHGSYTTLKFCQTRQESR